MTKLPKRLEAALEASFLGGVSLPFVDRILDRSYIWEIPAGRVFIGGERGGRCGLIASGLARAYSVRSDGSQATHRRVTTGAAVGIHTIVGRQNAVHVQAITDVEFIELDPVLILQLARQDSTLAVALAQEIDRRLADTEAQLENVAGRVVQKLASALLDMRIEGSRLEVQLSQEQLAEAIGASREHVGHELRELARRRLVSSSRGRVLIVDAIGLAAIARGQD